MENEHRLVANPTEKKSKKWGVSLNQFILLEFDYQKPKCQNRICYLCNIESTGENIVFRKHYINVKKS
jgi:hypothetical protein